MTNPATIEELRRLLDAAGARPGSYAIQELGEGEINGIGFLDGAWCTYYSERGSYNGIRRFPTEAAAIEAFLDRIRPILADDGVVVP
ncbi:hypothetical protein BurJ1DRAFT_0616 [Burkholderiales bacterium JOSHI_001]|nr:hypothetical protein BurJ1DRAFT_0616 [Burkholderiales bacterium JOSHI_001]